MPTPQPARRRPVWPQLPAPVRAAVEDRLGARVTGWASRDGGYSPGMASVLETTRGRVFVKATGPGNDVARALYREEARRAAVLPPTVPAPRVRWSLEVGTGDGGPGWVVVAADAVAGRPPRTPWHPDELDAVVDLARRVAAHEVPAGVLPEAADELPSGRWAVLADDRPQGLDTYDPWVAKNLDRLAALAAPVREAVTGPHLAHGDLRGDNALVVPRAPDAPGAVAVDWPYAVRAAPFLDLVAMLPSVRLEGGPEPEEVLRRHPLPTGVEDDAVTCYLADLVGYFVHGSLQPPPPGIPHVRAFQRAQAEVGVAWLRRRLGE
ncbi:phosphotransferase [Puerhibacterium puerhi]|uniref:phosphotransferase n=1 Tax=Puerhibacterium puerhi TaxID=2692623 RepID=UPI0013584FC7|nr:phosphotransferase [Puerhibacterium puerhi]